VTTIVIFQILTVFVIGNKFIDSSRFLGRTGDWPSRCPKIRDCLDKMGTYVPQSKN